MPPPVPHLPFARLRSSCSDLGRALLERAPQWAHLAPERGESTGDRATTSYRIAPGSFWLQQRWRLVGDDWQERELDVVPGSIVALRFVLDDVAPAEVSRKLDLVPTRAFAKDEAGTRGRGVRAEGLWIHEVLPDACRLPEEKLAELVALLRARAGLAQVLGQRGVTWAGITVALRCPIERPGGVTLEPRVIEDLAGLALGFDLALRNE